MIKIGMASLGCPKNQVDAEIILSKLRDKEYEITPFEEEAEVIIVNTCGFIESAKQESIDTILELSGLKKTGKLKCLIVTGCLAERYREQLKAEIPEIDTVVGIGQNEKIAEIIEKEYHVVDMPGLAKYLKSCGVNPKKFKQYISVEEKVNQQAINELSEIGDITAQDIEGCYELKQAEGYLTINAKKEDEQ